MKKKERERGTRRLRKRGERGGEKKKGSERGKHDRGEREKEGKGD